MGFIEKTAELKSALSSAQLQMTQWIESAIGIEVEIEGEKKASYDKGFADGKASMGEPGDKIYSQVEMDAAVSESNAKFEEMKASYDEMKPKFDELVLKVAEMESGLQGKIDEAVAAFKVDLAKKYEDLQVAETEAETGFGNLLK